MIPDILYDISNIVDPSIIEIYVNIETMFDQIQYREHEEEINSVRDFEDATTTDILDGLNTTYNKHLVNILEEYGVLLNTEVFIALRTMQQMVMAMNAVSIPDNADIVKAISKSDEDMVEKLALIVSQLSDLTVHNVLMCVLSVDGIQVKNLLQAVEPLDEYDPTPALNAVSRYKRYNNNNSDSLIYEFIKRRGTLPLILEQSIAILRNDLLSLTDPDKIVYEYLSLLYASSVPSEDLRVVGMDVAQELFPIETYVKISAQLESHLSE